MFTAVRWLVRGSAVVVFVASAACSEGTPAAKHASPDLFQEPATSQLLVRLEDVKFSTPRIEVASGALIELNLVNSGVVDHDFTIRRIDVDTAVRRDSVAPASHSHQDEASVHVALNARHEAMLRLHLHRPGTYEYYCSTPGHREAGMKGILVVA